MPGQIRFLGSNIYSKKFKDHISNIFRWRGAGSSRNGNGFAQQDPGSIRVRNCGSRALLAQTTARVGQN